MRNFIEDEFQSVEIPESLHERCCLGIQKAEGERPMKYKKTWMKRMSVAAAAFAVCVIAFNSLAIADTIKGMFRDIVRLDGAVTGTAYEVGVDEIQIQSQGLYEDSENVNLKILMTFANSNKPPYSELEALQIGSGQILDQDGNVAYEIQAEADMLSASVIESGSVTTELKMDKGILSNDQEYTLKINILYGHKKADAPLEIRGDWEIKINPL